MTKLRDDGYLEIGAEPKNDDDSIVAACFLGRGICVQFDSDIHPVQLVGVSSATVDAYVGDNEGDWFAYPILIPASTVAEVWEEWPPDIRYATLLSACGPTKIHDWLRTHTQEEKQ